MRSKLFGIAVIVSALFSGSSWAKWEASTKVDAMTDKVMRQAVSFSAQKHLVGIDRDDAGRVWMSILIPGSDPDMFEPELGVMLRVDSNKALEFKPLPSEIPDLPNFFYWTPKYIRFLIWHGVDAQGRSKAIKEIMSGKVMVIRFFATSFVTRDIQIDLSGARSAIASALEIPEQQTNANALSSALSQRAAETLIKCSSRYLNNLSAFNKCSRAITGCQERTNNLQGLELCLAPVDARLN